MFELGGNLAYSAVGTKFYRISIFFVDFRSLRGHKIFSAKYLQGCAYTNRSIVSKDNIRGEQPFTAWLCIFCEIEPHGSLGNGVNTLHFFISEMIVGRRVATVLNKAEANPPVCLMIFRS